MTSSELDPDAAPAAAQASDEPVAARPRRRRAADPVAEGTAAPPVADAAAEAPTIKRRTRRKPDPAEAASTIATAAPALVPTPQPIEAAPGPAGATEPLAVTATGVTVDRAAPATAGVDECAPAAGSGPADASPAADDGGVDGANESVRRRNRNRRRGRRRGGEGDEVQDDAVVVTIDAAEVDDDEAPAPLAAADVMADTGDTFSFVRSAEFDTEPPGGDADRRVLGAEPDAPKLHKVLAQAGIGSRRDMEELIAAGQVKVNGQVAHTGQRVSFGDRIAVGGRLIKVRIVPPPARVIAYHKPVGEIVTRDDPQQRPTVFRQLPRLAQGKWQSVGRLDINTEGLLLFTTSGELANQLTHPRFGVEREYAVRVIGQLDDEARARLLEGVDIDGQRAAFKSIADGGGEGVNHWYRVVISEGRNREVRRMFDRVGLGVSRLIRIRYGCVVLPRGLRRGVFVDLNRREVAQLRALAAPRGPRDASRPPPDSDGSRHKQRRNRRGGGRGPGERVDERPRRGDGDEVDYGSIPNPLQQTFDKRAIREARQPRREIAEDGPIPNPLEQTYDRRFVQKQRGSGGGDRDSSKGGQPDPMKTSVGYIGADAFVRKFQGGSGGRWGGKRGGGGRR